MVEPNPAGSKQKSSNVIIGICWWDGRRDLVAGPSQLHHYLYSYAAPL
jgi:hypothetical protein